MVVSVDLEPLTPAQRQVVEGLLALGGERPTFAGDLSLHLLDRLEEGLGPVADRLDPLPLSIRKGTLARVHQCERHYQEEEADPFRWSPASAKGTVAHRALQLAVFRTEPTSPIELVDEAMERIVETGDEWTPRDFLRSALPAEVAELRSAASDLVTAFQAGFPPLSPRWLPRLESPCRVDLCAGRVVLRSKVDLTLGRARGTEARVLIVDFKSGKAHPSHLDDLRFYALLETLRSGVPPFRVASYYLDAGRWQSDDVTVDILEGAVRRVVDGANKMADLMLGDRQPALTPGPACSYCRLRDTCPGGTEWAEQRAAIGIDAA